MTVEEKYLKDNLFPNIAIRNKTGVQAYMLSDILCDYNDQQIKELKEQIDELIIINQNLHNLNTCSSCKKLKVVLD